MAELVFYSMSLEMLEYAFHHLFLPSKLPDGDDRSPTNELRLVELVRDYLAEFLPKTNSSNNAAIKNAMALMNNIHTATDTDGYLLEDGVRKVLKRMVSHESFASFHITAQNAGVMLRRDKASVIFELFELSPTSESVYKTPGRLVRQFPAVAIGIPLHTYMSDDFQDVLAKTLVKMSYQKVSEAIPKVKKASQQHDEERDTIDPKIVTELLYSFLRGIGSEVVVTGISKNTREEIIWKQSKLPWRRCAVWLLIRVSLQLTLGRATVGTGELYKSFIIFFMSRILKTATDRPMESEVLKTMSTKISRRLLKLRYPTAGTWLTDVHETVSTTTKFLDIRWRRIRNEAKSRLDLTTLSSLNLVGNTFISIPSLNEFISSISKRNNLSKTSSFRPESDITAFRAGEFPHVPTLVNENEAPFYLTMVETWVTAHLDDWINEHISDESACVDLFTLMQDYHAAGKLWYEKRPEGASRMILVILELWIAADKAAVHEIPLLKHYEHGIPIEVFRSLLLGFRKDMERLHIAETYLTKRRDYARTKRKPSIFCSYGQKESFPVQFCSHSSVHQKLLYEIDAWASSQRQRKLEEYRLRHAEYEHLMQRYEQGVCQNVEWEEDGVQYTEHWSSCERCAFRTKATKMSIEVHEWPLSNSPLEAQATVFELALPESFGAWRDGTLYVIDDVLRSTHSLDETSASKHSLRSYSGLSKFFRSNTGLRVHLLSNSKPHGVTHRKSIKIGHSTESDVCVNNGLQFRYFDEHKRNFLDRFTDSTWLSELCTFELSGNSKHLKRFLVRTHEEPAGEAPNAVIASQASCPENMSLGEFKALATLPFGYRIQWMSILTQLAMPEVDFNKSETAILFLQLSLQAGPNQKGRIERCTHERLLDAEFGRVMLGNLQGCVSRIRENWESHTALWIFTFLAARLLSMTTLALKRQTLDLLKECREISHQWLAKLRSRAYETTDEDQRVQFLKIALRVSLICADTFNVDDEFLAQVLLDPHQSAILIENSININNNALLMKKGKDELEKIMYDRWILTMHRSRPMLLNEILLSHNSCLDIAIKQCWPDFSRASEWCLADSTCSWLETVSAQLKICVNLLTGELLVNGSPLSRLPREYELHKDYQKLFRSFILDVMPSSSPGMSFCSSKDFEGHVAHFGMRGGLFILGQEKDLLIRLEGQDSALDLIPSRLFIGWLPNSFVENYTHWYNHNTGSVEFRLIGDEWKSSTQGWILSRGLMSWKLTRAGKISLLSPGSSSANFIASMFSPLDTKLNLHMLLDEETGILEIKVKRLKLEFLLEKGGSVVESRQFRGMQIDTNQYIGTLIGFNSKLVLRDIQNSEARMVIIPEGKIDFGEDPEGHVNVNVTYGTAKRVQRYLIDNQLRRLVGNATVQSKLYLAYIHALTSYCISDPFLGRTGTEEGLSILNSASIRSMDSLTHDTAQLLQDIASLAPDRAFYPKHLKVMQTVQWSPALSFMAQDSRFYKIVKRVFDRVSDMSFLYPSDEVIKAELNHVEMDLVEREIFRNSRHQVSGFGAEDFSTISDLRYMPRDQNQSSPCAILANQVSFRVHKNIRTISERVGDGFLDVLYDLLSQFGETPAFRETPAQQEMQYGAEWLGDPMSFFPAYWCQWHFAFQTNALWMNSFQISIWLTTLAYSSQCHKHVLQALMMLPLSAHLAAAPLPAGLVFRLSEGYEVNKEQLQSLVYNTAKTFSPNCPEMNLSPRQNESRKNTQKRRKREFNIKKQTVVDSFVSELAAQWPLSEPNKPYGPQYDNYLNVSTAMASVREKWRIWRANLRFREYLEGFIFRLDSIELGNVYIPHLSYPIYQDPVTRPRGFISVDTMFSNAPPIFKEATLLNMKALQRTTATNDDASNKLAELLGHLDSQIEFDYERRYLSELHKSLLDLQGINKTQLKGNNMSMRSMRLEVYLQQCKTRVEECYNELLKAVLPEPTYSHLARADSSKIIRAIISAAGFSPRVSPIFFLQQLGRHRWLSLTEAWKKTIITYAIAITSLQQAQRLVQLQDNEIDLLQELESTGHRAWDPCKYPEWLLLECESGIIIRHVQHQIAEQMISPQDYENAVMQLNMGEGKSSVIVPIAATALSSGSQIVRVIVAKPQAKQMYQMLMSKLSGLLDRPIFQMPFSRAVRMDANKAGIVRNLALQCMREGGILMVQPEHLLSFQLMGLECQISEHDEEVARSLLTIQRLFDSRSRDIVDESDENFSPKFELVYTIGQQQPIEHTPDRWVIIQNVLSSFARICLQLKTSFPESLDVDDRHPERFPRIRILRDDAELAILDRLAEFICKTGMSGFPITQQRTQTRKAINRYISSQDLTLEEIGAVEQNPFWSETTMNNILLLRGLVSGGILSFAFGQKRWRVDYGTHPNRETKTRMAVPFRAKDNPTPRSEFSHPDVVIVLTCLSYYYKGLQDEELFEALELLMRSDNADLEYRAWVETAPRLPHSFQQLTGINIRDRMQCTKDIFPHLRYSKGSIDYFLSRMVFAKECREFPHKLSASGWDLGKRKTNPTTGFSGTNDSRYILPIDIKQLDLPEQNHTNALVLKYLLRPENGIMLMSEQMKGVTLESESLLEMVSQMSSNTRVILDVGAQIIDLDNLQFANTWLKSCDNDNDVHAVVFFSDADELMVLDRSGKIEPLQISPFATQLDQCLVFLDEAHTRGTDLRLPMNYQAAVTIGANLTKDKLVQACMRMRKLGQGQSVVFCIPREIEQKIQAQRSRESSVMQEITVSDVLCWAISETWRDLRRMVPLWLTQGVRFYEQEALWNEDPGNPGKEKWAKRFLEAEAQSLQIRYRPKTGSESAKLINRAGPAVRLKFQHRCEEFGLMNFRNSPLQEEQERELSPETEQERQVEQPPHVVPLTHSCHADLVSFIKLGEFPMGYVAFKPAFQALSETSAAKHFDLREFPSSIWATQDFSKTIKTNKMLGNVSDLFQRPVHWILTSKSDWSNTISHLVIISPWEAHELLPIITASKTVTLHLYAPRSNLGFQPLDQLTLYTVPQRPKKPIIPPIMMVELNIFAGQLYLSSFQEYIEVCNKLGVAWSSADDSVVLGPDCFIPPGVKSGRLVNQSGFMKSPVQFLKVLVTKIRRNCETVEKTHIGKILDGVLLLKDDFNMDE